MTFKRLITFVFPAFILAGIFSFTVDDDVISTITNRLAAWTEKHPIEKAYLHFDKPYYTAGEDIWFKAYVLTGPDKILQPDSGILNVELINDVDSIKQAFKIQLHNGLGYGDIPLPDTIHEGNYRIRAYTEYMRNAGSEYFFDKAIVIGNIISNKVFTKTTFSYQQKQVNAVIKYTDANGAAYSNKQITYSVIGPAGANVKGKAVTDADGNVTINFPVADVDKMGNARVVTTISGVGENKVTKSIPVRFMAGVADVQFFPEGGNLVNGIATHVAFKAIGTDGLGVDAKGTIVNNNGKQVAEINTTHLGMGMFAFTPQAGETYKAELTYTDGSKGTIPLPKANDDGTVLNVIGTDPNRIIVSVSSAKPVAGQLSLVAQAHGRVYYAAKSPADKATFATVIPITKFPSGIVQFTLFSPTGEPLNQRLVFVHGNDKLNITVTPDNQNQASRKPVTLNVEAKSTDGKPAFSSLSLAVINESKTPIDENTENNIFASLLLNADIKGYIEQPAYYFNDVNEKTRADLDMLMLTQGYHRFEWRTIAAATNVADKFPAQKTFSISGRVTTLGGQPVKGGKLNLLNFDHGMQKIDTLTDANGRFVFKDIIYPDSIKFLVQARTAQNKKDVVLVIDTIPPAATANYKGLPDFKANAGQSILTYAQNSRQFYFEQMKLGQGNHVISLAEVKITEKKNALKHSRNLNGPGNADQVLLAKDIGMGCVRLADCLQGRVAGVIFRNGAAYSTRGGGPMLVVVDGIYGDADLMNTINVNDVQAVEVIRSLASAVIYGPTASNGVLVITTKMGDEPSERSRSYGKGIRSYAPKGIYAARIFYSPKYEAKADAKLADLRSTIFWNPDVVTNEGKATTSYFNGAPGTYRIVVEGVDTDGRIGRQVLRYTVQ
ncbi:TonB-dependent receptor [Mucilaginibacter conchicola]|uniref:TonB-dependent receptor n=1 Tax=Mucilaginibacter conchicola TaxID=2303333 RepID=A0A372P027_9SPHI|nr:TonB-dependent receptor plug domain-containing protein [Mucilaginibacter conchicola]RFZ95632.1 TonB-dependent receptor [Mucilaginibacter conchicola]